MNVGQYKEFKNPLNWMRSRPGMEIPRVFYPPGRVFPCTVNDLTVAYFKAWGMNRWQKPALASVLNTISFYCRVPGNKSGRKNSVTCMEKVATL